MAEETGVPVSTVAALREDRLEMGVHWKKEGGRVEYTPEGLKAMGALLEALAGESAPPAPEPEKKRERGPVVRCKLLILRPNPTFVRVNTPEGPRDVRVRSHKGMTVGALLECCTDEKGTWICCNPRHSYAR